MHRRIIMPIARQSPRDPAYIEINPQCSARHRRTLFRAPPSELARFCLARPLPLDEISEGVLTLERRKRVRSDGRITCRLRAFDRHGPGIGDAGEPAAIIHISSSIRSSTERTVRLAHLSGFMKRVTGPRFVSIANVKNFRALFECDLSLSCIKRRHPATLPIHFRLHW